MTSVIARSVGGFLVGIPLFLASVLVWYLVARIATYGLFWDSSPGSTDPTESWGGPTLAGAWIVHALVALPLVVVAMWLISGLTRPFERMVSAPR